MTLLKIYALYKQASSGDVDGKRPGFTDMVGRAKWDAWNEFKGKSADEAMQEYVDLIGRSSKRFPSVSGRLLFEAGFLCREQAVEFFSISDSMVDLKAPSSRPSLAFNSK